MENDEQLAEFCRNILRLRKVSRLTQKEMAKILGCSVRSLSMLEHGKFPERLGVEVIFRAARYFHISPGELFLPFSGWYKQILQQSVSKNL